jgi:hypothetical protein
MAKPFDADELLTIVENCLAVQVRQSGSEGLVA